VAIEVEVKQLNAIDSEIEALVEQVLESRFHVQL